MPRPAPLLKCISLYYSAFSSENVGGMRRSWGVTNIAPAGCRQLYEALGPRRRICQLSPLLWNWSFVASSARFKRRASTVDRENLIVISTLSSREMMQEDRIGLEFSTTSYKAKMTRAPFLRQPSEEGCSFVDHKTNW